MIKWKSWSIAIVMLAGSSLVYGDGNSVPALREPSSQVLSHDGHIWKKTYTKGGDCHIDFPAPPQLVQQSMTVSEAGHKLLYDIYLSPFQNRGVFLLLIATYPGTLNKGSENIGLEGLVKGIVSHHADNQLIFSDLVEFMGRPAINFLVQSGSNYFRGQAVMVGNKLYLIAMEGKKGELDEQIFSRFVKSFQLLSP